MRLLDSQMPLGQPAPSTVITAAAQQRDSLRPKAAILRYLAHQFGK